LNVTFNRSRRPNGANIFVFAWEILQRKRSLSETSSMHIILGSVSAAHKCAREINRRSASRSEAHLRNKLYKVFGRIAKCTKPAPERLRHRLDQSVISLVHQDPIDLEVIEATLDATASLFLQYCEEESAKTALERSRSQTSLELDI
jgi:hypothetical protein